MAAPSTAEIVAMYHERKKNQDPRLTKMTEVRDQYNGDVVVPLPELEKFEKNAIPSLLQMGLDGTAMRIASTQPEPYFAPKKPGPSFELIAENQRLATLGWWDANEMEIKDGRRSRHLVGYASSPVILVPDFNRKMPRWQTRDPLMTYPAPTDDYDEMTPDDCIFAYYRSRKWLKVNYPLQEIILDAYRKSQNYGYDSNPNEMFTILEYIDCDEMVLIVIGTRKPYDASPINGAEVIELMRLPNKAGVCTAVVPGRVTLDTPLGQFDGMIGMFMQQSMLQALAVIATKKGIYKDQWIIARPNEVPKVVRQANGLKGITGIVMGGEPHTESLDPSYMAPQMIDRLEAYQRQAGGVPSQMTGENPSSVRTGRASDSIIAAQVDPVVQEAQRVLARARHHENNVAIAIDKAYWGKESKSFFIPDQGRLQRLDYVPNDLWDFTEHRVWYSHAGVDENGRTIEVTQLVGAGMMPKEEARKLHPLIRDAVKAGEKVIEESLEQAMMSALQQAASQPGANVADYAQIIKYVTEEHMTLTNAILKQQEEAQKRQASVDDEGNEATVDPNSPAAQPGLAAPGQGAEAGAAPIGLPAAGQSNLAQLLSTLNRPEQAAHTEQQQGQIAKGA